MSSKVLSDGFNYQAVVLVDITGAPYTVSGSGGSGGGGSVTQSGAWNVGVNNFPSTYAVTGTFWQTIQPTRLAVATPSAPSATSITTGGTAQTLFSASGTGQEYEIFNPITATENLYISDGGTASDGDSTPSTLAIIPGGYYQSPSKTANAISIYGNTTGHAFYARSW